MHERSPGPRLHDRQHSTIAGRVPQVRLQAARFLLSLPGNADSQDGSGSAPAGQATARGEHAHDGRRPAASRRNPRGRWLAAAGSGHAHWHAHGRELRAARVPGPGRRSGVPGRSARRTALQQLRQQLELLRRDRPGKALSSWGPRPYQKPRNAASSRVGRSVGARNDQAGTGSPVARQQSGTRRVSPPTFQ